MKIVYEHSHLNGKEFLQIKCPTEMQEIIDVVTNVNGDVWKKSSEKNKNNRAIRNGLKFAKVYDQKDLNKQFKEHFREYGWHRKYYKYFATPDEQVAREIMSLAPEQAKKVIQSNQLTLYKRSNETDFMKNKIAVEVQFGKYSFVAYDFFVKHMAFFISGDINVGVEIIPTEKC